MNSGRPPGAPRPGVATTPRDHDKTDPNATYPAPDEAPVFGVPGGVALDDETQVYDLGSAQQAMEAPASGFVLMVLAGPKAGARFDLAAGEVIVGRSDEAGISIPDVSVSRRHATFELTPDGTLQINDLGSGNGTKINGARIVSGAARHGDEIAVGDTLLQLVDESAPPPTPGRRAPIVITGEAGSSAASTRFDNPKVAQAEVAPQSKASNKRMRIYAIVGATLVAVFVIAALLKRDPSERPRPPVVANAAEDNLFRDAKSLAFNQKWVESVRLAEEALELSEGDAAIEEFLEKARVEAKYQQQVAEAKEKLEALDFRAAEQLLAQVPRIADVEPQARQLRSRIDTVMEDTLAQAAELAGSDKEEAKALVGYVLAARPDHAGARSLMEALEKPEPVVRAPRATTGRPSVSSGPVAPKPASASAAAPKNSAAREAFVAGDLTRALRLADEGTDPASIALAKQMRAFDTNYRQGMQLAKEERAAEAVKVLGVAVRIDKSIADGQSSKPGAEARLQLANMEYLLGIYCKGDEGLPCAARHFRAALVAEPSHQLASRQLNKVEARAREIYTEAYVAKGSSPDRALRLFKISRDSLLPSDETHQKADRWYQNLGGS